MHTDTILVPRSGQILGVAVRALKIKVPKQQEKNAQRYFSGETIRPQTMHDLHAAIAKAVASDDDFAVPAIQEPIAELLGYALNATADRWNDFAGCLETVIPTDSPDDPGLALRLAAPVFLSLTAFDLALRFAALYHLLGSQPRIGHDAWSWASDEHGGMLLRRLLKQANITRDDLSETLGYPPNTIDTWLEGAFRPEGDNLASLARVLASKLGRSSDDLRRELHRHLSLASLASKVAPVVGRPWLAESAMRFSSLSELTYRFIAESTLQPSAKRDAFQSMVAHGTRYHRCEAIAHCYGRQEEDPYWRRIFSASVKDWLPWLQIALTQSATVLGGIRLGVVQDDHIDELRDHVRFSMSDFLTPPNGKSEAEWHAELNQNPEHAYAIYTMQGEQFMGLHEYRDAARCFRVSVALMPENPHTQHRLGCALWLAALDDLEHGTGALTTWFDEAAQALWIAARIAEEEGEKWHVPHKWDLPLVELGWISLETGRVEEALRHAEGLEERLGGLTDRAAFFLGHARMMNGDIEGACAAFEACLRLNPRHLLAREALEVCRKAAKGSRPPRLRRR